MIDMIRCTMVIYTVNYDRDLKLENFLFEFNTPNSRLKLIDFGLSKYFDAGTSMYQVNGHLHILIYILMYMVMCICIHVLMCI